jgi:hypothetical protein
MASLDSNADASERIWRRVRPQSELAAMDGLQELA